MKRAIRSSQHFFQGGIFDIKMCVPRSDLSRLFDVSISAVVGGDGDFPTPGEVGGGEFLGTLPILEFPGRKTSFSAGNIVRTIQGKTSLPIPTTEGALEISLSSLSNH